MRTPSENTTRFLRDLAIFFVGIFGAIWEIFFLAHPDPVALSAISLFLFGPAALQGISTFTRPEARKDDTPGH